MQKVKHDFQVANQEILFGKLSTWHRTADRIAYSFRSYFMFNIQTINCMHACSTLNRCNSNSVAITQSLKQINTHGKISSKTQRFPLIWKEAIWTLLKKKENKKERVTESLHSTVKIARRSNYNMTLVSETLHLKQNNCRNHKVALNDKPTDSRGRSRGRVQGVRTPPRWPAVF